MELIGRKNVNDKIKCTDKFAIYCMRFCGDDTLIQTSR